MVMKKTGKIYHQPFALPMVSVDLTVSLLIPGHGITGIVEIYE